jgi:hypothetical protein
MGRAGIEPATLGLRVRSDEPKRTTRERKCLQRCTFSLATNCHELHRVEGKPVRARYAQRGDLRLIHTRSRPVHRYIARRDSPTSLARSLPMW